MWSDGSPDVAANCRCWRGSSHWVVLWSYALNLCWCLRELANISGAPVLKILSENLCAHAEASPCFFGFSKQISSIVTDTITTSKTAGAAM
jgi:hypothetical protein